MSPRRRRSRARRSAAWVLFAIVAALWIVLPGTAPALTAATAEPVTLTGLEAAEAAPMVAAAARRP